MPQKVCGGDILHVMVYAFYSENEKNGAFQNFQTQESGEFHVTPRTIVIVQNCHGP